MNLSIEIAPEIKTTFVNSHSFTSKEEQFSKINFLFNFSFYRFLNR